MIKSFVCGVLACLTLGVGAAAAADSDDYSSIITTLATLDEDLRKEWSPQDEDFFLHTFGQLDQILKADPYGPLSKDWFKGQVTLESGVSYGPLMHMSHRARQLLSESPREFASEHARHFGIYVGIAAGYMPHQIDPCIPQRVLAAQGAAKPASFDALILAALPASVEMQRLSEHSTISRQKALLSGDNPYEMDPALVTQGLRAEMLMAAVVAGESHADLLKEPRFDEITGAEFSANDVEAAVDFVLSEYATDIAAARPFYEWLNDVGMLNNNAIYAEFCSVG